MPCGLVGDQGLDAAVAGVLEALEVGAVFIGIVGTASCRVYSHLVYAFQLRVVGIVVLPEPAEIVGLELQRQLFQLHRRVQVAFQRKMLPGAKLEGIEGPRLPGDLQYVVLYAGGRAAVFAKRFRKYNLHCAAGPFAGHMDQPREIAAQLQHGKAAPGRNDAPGRSVRAYVEKETALHPQQAALIRERCAAALTIEQALNERLSIAGIEAVEARINYLAYAPEIAAVMLRRQQADAIIAAREKIVEGAVSMVKMALDQLKKEGVVELDEERKATMVSNLLVVLCSEDNAQPVVNAGSLYN